MSLKNKTISGLKWSFTDSMVNQVVHFVFGIVLARLLSPSEYGIIGMSMVFVLLFEKLVDGGLEQALIRKQNCSEADYNTMFYTNIAVGFITFLVLFFASNKIAKFYNNSDLSALVRVMSLNLIINSFGMVERAILIRNIDFKRQTKINFMSSASSGIVGIVFAFFGFGYWSLAIKTLWQNLSRVFLLRYYSNWKPKLIYSVDSFKELFGFGSKMLGASILHSIYQNIYSLVIGKYYSAAELGYYSRANQFRGYITTTIESSTQRVTYPVLSKLIDDDDKLRTSYKTLIKLIFFITVNLLFIMLVNAREIVLILIGTKWSASIPYLQILCVGGILYPLQLINLNVLKAKGRSDLYLKIEIIEKILSIPALITGVIYGMKVLVWGVVANSVITFLVNSMYSGKMINYPTTRQLGDILPIFLNASIMAVVVFVAGLFMPSNNVVSLVVKSFVAVLYIICTGWLFKIPEYIELQSIVLDLVKPILNNNYTISR